MDLKAFELRRTRGLHRRIIRNLNSRRRYAQRKGRGFTPDSESIQKRFYCYYLLDTLDCFYLRDQAFHRDPDCWHKKKRFCDISFLESSERRELLGSSFPEELLPEPLPENEPYEKSEYWWEFLRGNTNHLDSLEGNSYTEWQVDLYEYKGTYYIFHDARVDEYDIYREAKNRYKRLNSLKSSAQK